MANRAGPNDWLSADPVDDNGHVAYQLNVNIVGGGGAPADSTIVSPLGTNVIADSVSVTPATSSLWTAVGTAASGAAAAGAPVQTGGVFSSTYGTLDDGDAGATRLGATGNTRVELFIPGTTSGIVGNTVVSPVSTAVGLIVASVPKSVTSGGLTPARVVTGTTGVVKNSAGQLYTLSAYNSNAAVRFLHLYNKASAPTLSTDTPVMTFPLLASGITHVPLSDIGIAFALGIAWAYTTDNVAIPTTAGTTGELTFTAGYT